MKQLSRTYIIDDIYRTLLIQMLHIYARNYNVIYHQNLWITAAYIQRLDDDESLLQKCHLSPVHLIV